MVNEAAEGGGGTVDGSTVACASPEGSSSGCSKDGASGWSSINKAFDSTDVGVNGASRGGAISSDSGLAADAGAAYSVGTAGPAESWVVGVCAGATPSAPSEGDLGTGKSEPIKST